MPAAPSRPTDALAAPTSATLGVSLRRINKRIGNHFILRDVSLELAAGEVHVLVGANGAGKSTLIRILTGADVEFEGELFRDGRALTLRNPQEARRAGIHVIHQELSLVNCLSAVDNWVLFEERPALSWLSRGRARMNVQKQCERLGLRIDVTLPVERLSLSERQLLEIARALSGLACVLVLDEPTSALSEREAERLLEQLQRLRESGASILYVSHRLEEIYKIADRISVLRDGQLVATRLAKEFPRHDLMEVMTGSSFVQQSAAEQGPNSVDPQPAIVPTASRLCVRNLYLDSNPALRDISFDARRGEVLGVCGLRGSGDSELLEVLGGAIAFSRGSVALNGAQVKLSNPQQAFAAGVAYLAADRNSSVFSGMSIVWNGCMSTLGRYSRLGILNGKRCRRDVSKLANSLALGQYSLETEVGCLSGGNQQKVALLRCMLAMPQVLLLSEPTRGVDIAAKSMLHDWIRVAAQAGLTILLQSSELDELMVLCERVLVLRHGRVAAQMERATLSRSSLLSAMMG
ncbi:MAG TPA: sugar ABC transporter ATP-binding protein [Polyangiaceae bacterium]